MKRSINIQVPVATVSHLSILVYSYIKGSFLLLTRGGITPKRLLISTGEMESLPSILSPPYFKPVMAEKSYGVNIT